MSLAIAERKLTHPGRKRWLQEGPKKRKGKTQKKEKPAIRSFDLDFAALFKTAAETFARGVLVLAFCYGAFHGYLFLTSSSRFAVSQISIEGLDRLNKQSLLESMPLIEGKNLFLLDLESITERLTGHPWVSAASVQRKWPNAVTIQIAERKPYARIQLDDIYVMDNFGILVTRSQDEFLHLPLITGTLNEAPDLGQRVVSNEILKGLRAMHYLNRLPFFKKDPVTSVQITGPSLLTFSTREQGLKIRMAANDVQAGFQNFKIILDALNPTRDGVDIIDLSFRNKVVIQPKPGNKGSGHRRKA
ncbi:MAG: FtsQ-type POTRA domain-containing protein [Candidatus Nitronauta litoralis]|uniref:FtsQ-type POTRA domain-containing protein n=1 Tax=Candidatus Nitronauta litoralis TaxID=2705533 RepID=A0A7T0FZC5_9BACT|nr:MAG: FtsQ-type POTRA domain-containing protein [Candidatus Nitronauta litoralis]